MAPGLVLAGLAGLVAEIDMATRMLLVHLPCPRTCGDPIACALVTILQASASLMGCG